MAAKRRTPLLSSRIITIRLTAHEKLELERLCEEQGATAASFVRGLIASAATGEREQEDGGASLLLAAL